MLQSHTVLEVSDGVLDLCVSAMVSFKFQGVALSVGDEGVVAVVGEQRQLGAGRGLDPSDYQTHRHGVRAALEWVIRRLGHVCRSIHPVGYGCPVGLGHGLLYIVSALQTRQFVRWVRGACRWPLGEPGSALSCTVSRRKLAAPRAVLALPLRSRAISTSPVPAATATSG